MVATTRTVVVTLLRLSTCFSLFEAPANNPRLPAVLVSLPSLPLTRPSFLPSSLPCRPSRRIYAPETPRE